MIAFPASRATVAAVVTIASLLVAGCKKGDAGGEAADSAASDSAPAASASAADPAGVVTVTATDFAFDAPAEVPAGLTTFRLVNRGPSLHHIQLIRLDSGKTVADFEAALKKGGPPPRWAVMAGGPNPPEVGQTASATVPLEPGTYVMLCFIPAADGMPHVMKGMSKPITVTGPAPAGGAEPTADAVVTLKDYDFTLSKPLAAGKQTIRVDNAGPQPHEVAVIRLKPGKTPEDFERWGEKPVGEAPGTLHGGVSGIMPGTHAFMELDLPAGDYALICFVPDGKDGKPHFVHGMSKRIKVG
jgi:hypothetical protein